MTPTSRQRTGYGLTGLVTLFLLFDSGGKLLRLRQMVEGTAALGYADSAVRVIGAILLACLILYLIPRTAVLGGVLLTGYLGGAVASNLRVGNPLISHTLFPIYVGALIWGSLLLREDRLRALVPVRQ
ncbi:MAG TPA: DoxX family protein [Gemmatimonadales bacterium]|nr:DoxX family protein [Gemmatimonadales bacterium]